jgi:hypothetical protein
MSSSRPCERQRKGHDQQGAKCDFRDSPFLIAGRDLDASLTGKPRFKVAKLVFGGDACIAGLGITGPNSVGEQFLIFPAAL